PPPPPPVPYTTLFRSAVAIEDHVDSTEADLVEARISDLNRLIPLLGLEQLPEPVPKLRRGHDQVRTLRAIRAAGDHMVDHRKGQRLTLSIMVLGLPPRMLRAADTTVEIDVRAVVHSGPNARDVLAVVARAVTPELLREHIPKAQAGDFHLRLQEVQHSQVSPVLRFLKVGDGDGDIELLPLELRSGELVRGADIQHVILAEAAPSRVLRIDQRLDDFLTARNSPSPAGEVPQGRHVVEHVVSQSTNVVLAGRRRQRVVVQRHEPLPPTRSRGSIPTDEAPQQLSWWLLRSL